MFELADATAERGLPRARRVASLRALIDLVEHRRSVRTASADQEVVALQICHTRLGMRGRSPCLRERSQVWQQRRHMLVVMIANTLSRRAVVAGLPLLLAGCSGGYGSITGEPYSVPFVSMLPDLMRQEVAYGAP